MAQELLQYISLKMSPPPLCPMPFLFLLSDGRRKGGVGMGKARGRDGEGEGRGRDGEGMGKGWGRRVEGEWREVEGRREGE